MTRESASEPYAERTSFHAQFEPSRQIPDWPCRERSSFHCKRRSRLGPSFRRVRGNRPPRRLATFEPSTRIDEQETTDKWYRVATAYKLKKVEEVEKIQEQNQPETSNSVDRFMFNGMFSEILHNKFGHPVTFYYFCAVKTKIETL